MKDVSDLDAKVATLESMSIALVEEGETKNKFRPYCTGTWVSEKHILTAAHCVDTAGLTMEVLNEMGLAGMVELFGFDAVAKMIGWNAIGEKVMFSIDKDVDADTMMITYAREATVIDINSGDDIALVRVDGLSPSHVFAKARSLPMKKGEIVHYMGHPIGNIWSYFTGRVAGLRKNVDGLSGILRDVIQLNMSVGPGSSGSGVLDDQLMLVGVVSYLNTRLNSSGFAIGQGPVINMLERNGIKD